MDKLKTDLQDGYVDEFLNKENKWFNRIKGMATTILNIDTSEFTVQGIGSPNAAPIPTIGTGGLGASTDSDGDGMPNQLPNDYDTAGVLVEDTDDDTRYGYPRPSWTSEIGRFAFERCIFTEITLPRSVTTISEYAFYYCRGLTKVTLPSSLTTILLYTPFTKLP